MNKVVRCEANALIIRSLPRTGVDTDTGKRLIKGQLAVVHGESFDKQWFYVDAPAGRGWSSKQYLSEVLGSDQFLPDPAWPKVPNGRAEIERLFGSPGSAPCSAGRCHLPAPLKLGWADQKVTAFACHKLVEDVFSSFFHELHRRSLWDCIGTITACVETFDGAYNPRTVTASQKVSTHAWGIAFDINAARNPLGRTPTIDQKIVAIGKDHNLTWGGDWSRPDGMHFQYARGY